MPNFLKQKGGSALPALAVFEGPARSVSDAPPSLSLSTTRRFFFCLGLEATSSASPSLPEAGEDARLPSDVPLEADGVSSICMASAAGVLACFLNMAEAKRRRAFLLNEQ
jgi:hypothetical protein